MNSELRGWIDRHFTVPRGGRSKVMALADAVADNVRPGDAVHLGVTHSRGSAAFWELIRRFRGTDPRLTLLAVQMTSPEAPLVVRRSVAQRRLRLTDEECTGLGLFSGRSVVVRDFLSGSAHPFPVIFLVALPGHVRRGGGSMVHLGRTHVSWAVHAADPV